MGEALPAFYPQRQQIRPRPCPFVAMRRDTAGAPGRARSGAARSSERPRFRATSAGRRSATHRGVYMAQGSGHRHRRSKHRNVRLVRRCFVSHRAIRRRCSGWLEQEGNPRRGALLVRQRQERSAGITQVTVRRLAGEERDRRALGPGPGR
jgi:hypothetical protein